MMGRRRLVGWVIIALAVPFWVAAIIGASTSGFFETELSVQLMIMGGAISMIGGAFLFY